MGLDVDRLLNALENENNESLLDLNKEKISTMKNDILQKLNIKNDKLKLFHKKLKLYRYVDNVEDINYGSFIRWISLKTPNDIKLTNGGIVCDMKTKDESIYIICKNSLNRFFTLTLEENIIFQKLSNQEEVILSAMNYLNK
jgi:hypothetical protein